MTDSIEKPDVPFAQIANVVLNSKELSFKAKGLYAYMISKPSTWKFTIRLMTSQVKDGEASIVSGIKELKDAGLVTYIKNKDGSGKYILKNDLKPLKTPTVEPNLGNPDMEKPNLGNQDALVIKNSSNKEKSSNNKVNTKSQNEIIDSFIPNETSLRIVSEKYFDRQITQQDINALIMDFQISMRNREAKWKDIQSCFQRYTSKGWITMPEDKQMSYSDIAKALESQRNNLIIESEKGGLDGISSS